MKLTKRVAVLMGGPSAEYEISLKSGQGAAEALRRSGYQVECVGIPHSMTVEDAQAFTKRVIPRLEAAVIFLALHGTFGEDGTIQQICEELHVAYTGSDAAASRLGMDKIASRQRFLQAGLHIPRWRLVTDRPRDIAALEELRYPLIVKPSDQGSSVGISLVAHPGQLLAGLEDARRYSPTVIVEEFIKGRELTVGVIGEEVLPVVEIAPRRPFFDFTAKYTAGMTDYHVPAALAPRVAVAVQEAGLRAHDAIGCRHFSRTDMMLTEEGTPVVLEVNTIPGLTPTSLLPKAAACAGLTYEALCAHVVEMAFDASVVAVPALSGHPS